MKEVWSVMKFAKDSDELLATKMFDSQDKAQAYADSKTSVQKQKYDYDVTQHEVF